MSNRLTFDDAVNVWYLLWQGWHQHDIAALYHVNQGRISEIHTEQKFVGSKKEAMKRFNRRSA